VPRPIRSLTSPTRSKMADSHVIALKFRPKTFDQVVGQEAIIRTLKNAIESERIYHAYLFAGARGVGKTTTARIVAKALNCAKGPTIEPCGECDSCVEIATSSSVDVLEIDAASNTGVENVRTSIISSAPGAPWRDRYRIFIIDEVHQLSNAAFNALLKTIEEPPPSVVFILATTELQKVPDTILSRCQVFEFRTISQKKIFDELRRIATDLGLDITDSALAAIARAGEGSMRDAESSLDQVISFSGKTITDEDVSVALGIVDAETLNRTLRSIAEHDGQATLKIVDEVVARGYDIRNFCRELMTHIRALLVIKLAGFDAELLQAAPGEAEALVRLAEEFSEQDLIRFFSILTKTEQDIRVSPQPRFQLEIGLVKLSQLARLHLLEDALATLEGIASRLPVSSSRPVPAVGQQPQRVAPVSPGVRPQAASPAPARNAPRTAAPHNRAAVKAEAPRPSAEAAPAHQHAAMEPPAAASPVIRQSSETGKRDPGGNSSPIAHDAAETAGEPPEPPPWLEVLSETAPRTGDQPAQQQPERHPRDGDTLQKLKQALEAKRKTMLATDLEQAERVWVEGNKLRISYGPDAVKIKSTVEKPNSLKFIQEACVEVLGKKLDIAVTIGSDVLSAPEPAPARAPEDRPENRPAVRALVERFQGEVIEVIEPEV
jgi:DNA polymerase-3 subunit gamma/tau